MAEVLRLLLHFVLACFSIVVQSSEVPDNQNVEPQFERERLEIGPKQLPRETDGKRRLSEAKESENKKRPILKLDLSYIAKPTSSLVDIYCRGNISGLSLRIICPKFDHNIENISTDFAYLETVGFDEQTTDGEEYSYRKRTLQWKSFEKFRTSIFSCQCQVEVSSYLRTNFPKITIRNRRPKKNVTKLLRRRVNAKKFIGLQCYVIGGPTLNVTWYKDKTPLQLEATTFSSGIKYKLRNHALKLSRADPKGSGFYQCLARNMAGKAWGQGYMVILHSVAKCSSLSCHQNATCTHRTGLFVCNCNDGFTGNGRNCTDISQRIVQKCHRCTTSTNPAESLTRNSTIYRDPKFVNSNKPLEMEEDYDIFDKPSVSKIISERQVIGITTGCTVALISICAIFIVLFRSKKLKCFQANSVCSISSHTSRRRCLVQPCSISCNSDVSRTLNKLVMPPKANDRYFASGLVDHNGGHLVLSGTDIKLIIPEGAIRKGKTEAIYISLIETKQYFPQLEEGESLLSHVLMCGPHGLRFQKHVLLILPHCVVTQGQRETTFRVLCSNTAPKDNTNWEEIFNTGKDPSNDCFCDMDDSSFSLFVSHFSWYTIPGNCEKKKFTITGYHSKVLQPLEHFKIRIYCIPDFKEIRQEVEKEENEILNGEMSDARKPIIFYENGGDLIINTTHTSQGWKIINDKNKKLDYSTIWNFSMNPPASTFVLEHVAPQQQRQIYCTFNIVQKELEENFQPTEVIVSHVLPSLERFHRSSNSCSIGYGTLSGDQFSAADNTNIGFIPRELKVSLKELLEICIAGRYDYLVLTDELGFEPKFRQWLRTKSNSPTEHLLTKWEQTYKCDNPAKALRHLRDVLEKMGRHDAAEKVNKYCPLPIREQKVTTV